MKLPQDADVESNLNFKCDQCDYNHTSEKGLGMHKRMKHRISQVDGIDDLIVEDSEEDDTVTLVLDELGGIIGHPPKLCTQRLALAS